MFAENALIKQMFDCESQHNRTGVRDQTCALTDRLQAFVFVPDYTVKAITDVLYVRITRTTYMRAIKASLMASRKQSGHTGLTTKHIDSFFSFYCGT